MDLSTQQLKNIGIYLRDRGPELKSVYEAFKFFLIRSLIGQYQVNRHLAEDAASYAISTYIEKLKSGQIDEIEAASHYMFLTAKSYMVHTRQSHYFSKTERIEEYYDEFVLYEKTSSVQSFFRGESDSLNVEKNQQEVSNKVIVAIHMLPLKYRRVLLKIWKEPELNLKKVAEHCMISYANVRMIKMRGLEQVSDTVHNPLFVTSLDECRQVRNYLIRHKPITFKSDLEFVQKNFDAILTLTKSKNETNEISF